MLKILLYWIDIEENKNLWSAMKKLVISALFASTIAGSILPSPNTGKKVWACSKIAAGLAGITFSLYYPLYKLPRVQSGMRELEKKQFTVGTYKTVKKIARHLKIAPFIFVPLCLEIIRTGIKELQEMQQNTSEISV